MKNYDHMCGARFIDIYRSTATRNGVGSIPVGGNSPSVDEWIDEWMDVRPSNVAQEERLD